MKLRLQIACCVVGLSFGSVGIAGQSAPATNGSDALMQQGAAALQGGDLAKAESAFTKATESAPRSGEAYLGLGLVLLREGSMDKAIPALTKASELDPRLGGAHLFLGIARYQTGDAKGALESLQQEVQLDPNNVEALTWTGIIQLGSGHPEAATVPLDRASALNPKDPNLLYYRARAHSLVAEATYRQLYDAAPDSALVHRALAESLGSSNQPEKAIQEYELALAKEPNNADLYEGLGEQDQRLSRFDAARTAYQSELKLNARSSVALYNLGKMDVEAGKPESGIALLRQAQTAGATGAPAAFYLGLGLAQTGKNDEAAHWLEQALASQPSSFIEQSSLFQLGRVYTKLSRKADADRVLERLKLLKAQSSGTSSAATTPTAGLAPAVTQAAEPKP